jgi:TrmH family RNA methyltransferase
MLSKNRIKLITSLQQKKFRREEMLFVAEGEKVIRDLLKSGWDVDSIYATDTFFQNLGNDVRIAKSTEVELIEENELRKISNLTTPQKVLALVRIPDEYPQIERETGLKLVLDTISDPGNMGTIIRIADWFGIGEIICSEETVDCFNPKVVQGTMGSLFKVKIIYENLEKVFSENAVNQKLPVYAMDLKGESTYEAKYVENAYIILGSEAQGIDPALDQYITHSITIPAFNSGPDSLNVAIATGIICYEFRRHKK